MLFRSLHASFRPRLTTTPLRFANPSPPSGWVEDSHLQTVEHAWHTTKMPDQQRTGRAKELPIKAAAEPRSAGKTLEHCPYFTAAILCQPSLSGCPTAPFRFSGNPRANPERRTRTKGRRLKQQKNFSRLSSIGPGRKKRIAAFMLRPSSKNDSVDSKSLHQLSLPLYDEVFETFNLTPR